MYKLLKIASDNISKFLSLLSYWLREFTSRFYEAQGLFWAFSQELAMTEFTRGLTRLIFMVSHTYGQHLKLWAE